MRGNGRNTGGGMGRPDLYLGDQVRHPCPTPGHSPSQSAYSHIPRGLGQLPFPYERPRRSEDCGPVAERWCPPPGVTEEEQAKRGAAAGVAAAIKDASYHTFFYNQPSPLEAVPYRGRIEVLFSRAVIAPPTAPGDADGTTGATEVANAESAISGQTIPVLTPATTADYVTVLSFVVPGNSSMMVKGVGTWGHDFLAVRDTIIWRVRAGGVVISDARELGLVGSLDSVAQVHGVLQEGQTLIVEARNLDVRSASLVEVNVLAWTFPVSGEGNADTLESLLDPRARAERIRQRDEETRGRGCPTDPDMEM